MVHSLGPAAAIVSFGQVIIQAEEVAEVDRDCAEDVILGVYFYAFRDYGGCQGPNSPWWYEPPNREE